MVDEFIAEDAASKAAFLERIGAGAHSTAVMAATIASYAPGVGALGELGLYGLGEQSGAMTASMVGLSFVPGGKIGKAIANTAAARFVARFAKAYWRTATSYAIMGGNWLARKAGNGYLGQIVRKGLGKHSIEPGTVLYRVWGGRSGPFGDPRGASWTTVDPRTVPDFRNAAGLPDGNTGMHVQVAILLDVEGVTLRPAKRIGSQLGGIIEVLVPDPARKLRIIGGTLD